MHGSVDISGDRVSEIRVVAGANIAGVGRLDESGDWKPLAFKLEDAGYRVKLVSSYADDDALEITAPNGSTIGVYLPALAGVPQVSICD